MRFGAVWSIRWRAPRRKISRRCHVFRYELLIGPPPIETF
jgi:hypothetical protein